MKTKITIILALLISAMCIAQVAQQGINYKAQLKDGTGNIIANTNVVVLFTIYEGDALIDDVYVEQHAYTTDANGFIILNIGMGNTGDDFSAINWGDDKHYLNVQVNVDGAGLTDLGTTQFMLVPYAISSGDKSWESEIDNVHVLTKNVGIGTNTPTARLDIVDPDDAAIKLSVPTINDTSKIEFKNGDEAGFYSFYKIENRNDALRFELDSDILGTGYTTQMFLSSGGLSFPSGTSVNEFSTDGTLAGNSNNAVPTEQAVKDYIDAAVAAAGPIAYGSIAADGTINSGSGNFTVFKSIYDQYFITIIGETYNALDFTTVVTPFNSGSRTFQTGDDANGNIVVAFYADGNIDDVNFHFITYK